MNRHRPHHPRRVHQRATGTRRVPRQPPRHSRSRPTATTLHVFPEGQPTQTARAAVDQLAAVLGTTAHDMNGHYAADTLFGPLTYRVITISDAARAEHRARTSYADCIQLDDAKDLGAAA